MTYDTKYVPFSPGGLLDLSKRDLQLFFKRLRKSHVSAGYNTPIKYYAVGEYGGETQRPHYHVILFNAELELIQAAWKMGHIHYGKVSGASVGYTLKYMSKNKKQMKSWLMGRQKEFGVMSKGLGISYLNEEMANWHIADIEKHMYCTLLDGIKISMPRYYKDKLYYEQERANIRDAQSIVMLEEWNKKHDKQTARMFLNEQMAIDADYDRMYRSSLKTTI